MQPIVMVQENPIDVSSIWSSLSKWYRVVPNAALHNQTPPLLTASLTPWFNERLTLLRLVDPDREVEGLGDWQSATSQAMWIMHAMFHVHAPQERWDELVQHIKEQHGSNTRA